MRMYVFRVPRVGYASKVHLGSYKQGLGFRVRSVATLLITSFRVLTSLLTSTHEPPSILCSLARRELTTPTIAIGLSFVFSDSVYKLLEDCRALQVCLFALVEVPQALSPKPQTLNPQESHEALTCKGLPCFNSLGAWG